MGSFVPNTLKEQEAMLREAGVESDYYAISTRNANLKADFVSAGQMNHVMLAVPLPENRDTLFVECTNPSYPLGYRHFSCAGHQILLVREDGGHLVRGGLCRLPAERCAEDRGRAFRRWFGKAFHP